MADQSRVLKVTTRDRSPVELRGVWRDSVMVHGTFAQGSAPVQIPLEEVTKIEALRFSIGKTALLVVGVAGALIGAFAVLAITSVNSGY